jgi:5-methylcytosine-specific restriction enzyme subunit McrC
VGLLQTADGFQLEILPKIASDSTQSRLVLLNMLRSLPDLPFRTLPPAHLQTSQMPIWEVFVTVFLDELERIVQRGLQRSYQIVESESLFLRGKWLINKQIQQSKVSPTQFLVEYDLFDMDNAPNRLIKTCLVFLSNQISTSANRRRLAQLQSYWQTVPISVNINTDFQIAQHLNRHFKQYQTALQWAGIFLENKSWLGQKGAAANVSLLFQMERLFESYVSHCVKKYLTDYEVFTQQSEQFLIADHAGKAQYKLRPDLIVRQNNKTIIADLKWKQIDAHNANNQYGLDQRDLYQLYAYGQKYKADALFLIYPANANFTVVLPPFRYDDKLSLWAVPFDLTIPPSVAVQSVNLAVQAALV